MNASNLWCRGKRASRMYAEKYPEQNHLDRHSRDCRSLQSRKISRVLIIRFRINKN